MYNNLIALSLALPGTPLHGLYDADPRPRSTPQPAARRPFAARAGAGALRFTFHALRALGSTHRVA